MGRPHEGKQVMAIPRVQVKSEKNQDQSTAMEKGLWRYLGCRIYRAYCLAQGRYLGWVPCWMPERIVIPSLSHNGAHRQKARWGKG